MSFVKDKDMGSSSPLHQIRRNDIFLRVACKALKMNRIIGLVPKSFSKSVHDGVKLDESPSSVWLIYMSFIVFNGVMMIVNSMFAFHIAKLPIYIPCIYGRILSAAAVHGR